MTGPAPTSGPGRTRRRWAGMRARIVGLAVLAAVLATTLFGLPLAYGVGQYFLADERGELERLADAAAVGVTFDVAAGGSATDLQGQQGDVDVGFYDTGGLLVAGRGPDRLDIVAADALGDGRISTADDVGGQQVVAVPVTDGTDVRGVVRAASDYTGVRWRIGGTWAGMLALAAVATGITWLVARRQARRLVHPLEALAGAAERIGQGDFASRTERSGITELDTAGRALDSTAARLGALIDRERAFSADASHQLRTPLTGLRLELETAVDLPAAEHAAAMERALQSADRLETTIADLLALARETGGRGQPLDVVELVVGVESTWGPLLTRQQRRLRVAVDPELPVAAVSSAAVRQVIGVLMDNATVHGAGTVTLTVRDAGGAVAFDVADEGRGPVDADRSFTRDLHRDDGHGIGLSLARTLAEAEGGRLRLSRPSPPVFTLLLPAQPID